MERHMMMNQGLRMGLAVRRRRRKREGERERGKLVNDQSQLKNLCWLRSVDRGRLYRGGNPVKENRGLQTFMGVASFVFFIAGSANSTPKSLVCMESYTYMLSTMLF